MKTITTSTTALSAHNRKLKTPIPYSWSSDQFETYAEMVAANAGFSESELLEIRNNKLDANARSKAYQTALDNAGIEKPTAENDKQVALRDAYKTISVQVNPKTGEKYTHVEARARAAEFLGYEWED